jgi:hypothetical protein
MIEEDPWMSHCLAVINDLEKLEISAPFRMTAKKSNSVDDSNKAKIIKTIDLQSLKKKLQRSDYISRAHFSKDMSALFSNAKVAFAGDAEVLQATEQMEIVFKQLYEDRLTLEHINSNMDMPKLKVCASFDQTRRAGDKAGERLRKRKQRPKQPKLRLLRVQSAEGVQAEGRDLISMKRELSLRMNSLSDGERVVVWQIITKHHPQVGTRAGDHTLEINLHMLSNEAIRDLFTHFASPQEPEWPASLPNKKALRDRQNINTMDSSNTSFMTCKLQ